MQSLITSYLLQSKECILPGIGVFKIINTPATNDAANSHLLPPFKGIIFKKTNEPLSQGLIKYIADKKNIDTEEAKELLNNFCKEWKEKIDAGEKLNLETIGSIQKNADGKIFFQKEISLDFLHAIPVNDIYKRIEDPVNDEQENVLPDAEPIREEIIIERSYWGLLALILFAIGFVMMFYHFKDKNLNSSSAANQERFKIDSATATYTIPK